ncbi:MAG: hypothetical protein KF752_19035 [Pirellulaceae bacterium]|nr:hypothetical protein [Pirellulaceae bacterium]
MNCWIKFWERADSFRRAWLLGWLVLSIDCLAPQISSGQNHNPSVPARSLAQNDESRLVEGLLELSQPPQPTAEPGLADGASPDAPGLAIMTIRRQLQALIGPMNRGPVGNEAVRIQTEIIDGLDQLIAALEGIQPNQSESTSKQHSSTIASTSSRRSSTDESARQNDPASPVDGGPSPHAADRAANAAATGNRPIKADDGQNLIASQSQLQRGVWGHLPERVRSQLEARMVDQFLPSYRQQLEAYYRALLQPQEPTP